MRHNRIFVFAGAIGALIVMTILSVCIGAVMPAVLPKIYTHYAAAALFAYFGYRLIREAMAMTGKEAHEELAGWFRCTYQIEARVYASRPPLPSSSAETEAELGGGSEPSSSSGGGLELPPGATAITLSPPPTDDPAHKTSRPRLSGAGAAGAAGDWWNLSSAYAQLSLHLGRDWPVITQVRRDGVAGGPTRHHALPRICGRLCAGVHVDVPCRVGRPQPDCDDRHGRRTGQAKLR